MSRFRLIGLVAALGGLFVMLVLLSREALLHYHYARAAVLRREQQAAHVARLTSFRTSAGYWDDGSVRYLSLHADGKPRVTGRELSELGAFDALDDLYISGCSLSDDAFHQLGQLRTLGRVQLSSTEFSNESLQHLARLPRLNSLSFLNCSLSDAGLEYVAQVPRLRYLRIRGSKLTEAAVGPLAQMANLERLTLDRTLLSANAYAQLQKALPHTQIEWTAWDPTDRRFGTEKYQVPGEAGDNGVTVHTPESNEGVGWPERWAWTAAVR